MSMNKEEILERNRKYNTHTEEDEREQYISGKAGIYAKSVFTLVVVIIAMYKRYKNIPNGDVWCIFMTYCATESLYKYYYLKNKKLLLSGVFFSIFAICWLLDFVIL
ncbi:hypothetical protein psyc5s11_26940 [Clostridium gelidum]|uniref:Uncharacterized protein n=2 Tax=Clostridium gelidum TaxID=704125 RepID=A0ABM7T6T6_9CLOT|nr:hypothetical protein psyc5s11_26940 [Clostridium gelidum]